MRSKQSTKTVVSNAYHNNLKNINVSFPHNKITVLTGVSGSGKSTLAYNVIYRESQRRFFESSSAFTGKFSGKIEKPKVDNISGLQTALVVNQRKGAVNPRSTVGTLSDIYDYLRLLYARCGVATCDICGAVIEDKMSEICPSCHTGRPKQLAQLFSFNSIAGACPHCSGLGITEKIDVKKLIADESLTLRQGALVPTTPTGYIVYSQVTVDSLNEVCEAHGFNVDVPWKDLTQEQKDVILFGSDKVTILFGKHSLESRLKWKGITAKPREEGYYKGMIPIMEDILKRDRNDNILRFASAVQCPDCNGKRLRKEALNVIFEGKSISELSEMTIDRLDDFFGNSLVIDNAIANEIIKPIIKRIEFLKILGLGYLTCSRESSSLSGGEYQRIKLAQQAGGGLQNILYILDEPSTGLHPHDNERLINLMNTLRNNGNTLLVAEHERTTIKSADYLIDIGPQAGIDGGKVMFQGKPDELFNNIAGYPESITARSIISIPDLPIETRTSEKEISIENANIHNLKDVNVKFKQNAFNVVTGVSGAGKSTLIHKVLANYLNNKERNCSSVVCDIPVSKIIEVDQSPIGRTSRSNPATYTDLFAHIRTLFAKQPESIKRGYKSGRFSFNNVGGRCEKCQGAGTIQTGMHFLGNVESTCDVCNGNRFNDETLEITYRGKNIFDTLNMSVDEALAFFNGHDKIVNILEKLVYLGVGYLKLGQPSTTLSGGEAQRIKLASELYKTSSGHNLYLLDEPTLGLHIEDVKKLYSALNKIVNNNNTVIVIEHDPDLIIRADYIVDLGPDGGEKGGNIVFSGSVKNMINKSESHTAVELRKFLKGGTAKKVTELSENQNISFSGVTTNNLKNIDIEIPIGLISVITGVSGSGKSSLAIDTIYSESRNRFTENMSTYARRMMQKVKKPEMEQCSGLTPAILIDQRKAGHNPRSTVATVSGLYDYYRLLFSRTGINSAGTRCNYPASMLSYNNAEASCSGCSGLGILIKADPRKFITNNNLPLTNGAMDGSVPGKFFGDPSGMHVNALMQVGKEMNIDFSKPYKQLSDKEKAIALYGTGDIKYNVHWEFKRGTRSGVHELTTTWNGLINYFTEEYEIRKNTKRGDAYSAVVSEVKCDECNGSRLMPFILDIKVADVSIAELLAKSVEQSLRFFQDIKTKPEFSLMDQLISQCIHKLENLLFHDLGYIQLSRVTSTLSGGELQRLKIANQLIEGLNGLTYILDEPTAGLHPDNTHKLLTSLKRLNESGNTIILVEHDPDVICKADYIIDMGSGAGNYGGKVIASGNYEDIINNKNSVTGKWLKTGISAQSSNRNTDKPAITVKGAKANNLKNIAITIPAGCITTISGVSGSGKSSLAFDVIADSFNTGTSVNCTDIDFKGITGLKVLSQDRNSTSPLSTPLTWCGIMDEIQTIFARQNRSKELGLKKSHFSFNSKDGKCPTCKGLGAVKVSLDFLSDIWVTCDDCGGTRYKGNVLEVTYYGLNISDILLSEIKDLPDIFTDNKKIINAINIFNETGLGYLRAGQPLNTLSAGELQRLALAKEIIGRDTNDYLYILDEPTTGLHMQDISNLIKLFNKLTDKGNTLLIIEHNTDILKIADKSIVLGPGSGDKGGEVL